MTMSSYVRTCRPSGVALALLSLCAVAAAADYDDVDADWDEVPSATKLNDLRFGVSLLPITSEVKTQHNDVTSFKADYNFDKGGRTSLTWMVPLGPQDVDGGYIAGLELSRNRYIMEASSVRPYIDNKIWAMSGHVGISWVTSNRTHFETTGYLGYGTCAFTQEGHGVYWEYGFRAGFYYTARSNIQIGFHLDYITTTSSQVFTESATTYDLRMRSHGGYGGLTVGMRL